jgi:hypothetical protein
VSRSRSFIGELFRPTIFRRLATGFGFRRRKSQIVVIPRERHQDVDIQQIHASFLGQGVRDLFGRNCFARVMHQNAVLAVSLGRHRGKLCLRLAVLRDGELFAARDLPEQIRERGLGFFQCDRLHDAKNLPALMRIANSFAWRRREQII